MNPQPEVSDLALRAFAAGFAELRPDWDAPGIRTWLWKLIREDNADPFRAVAYMAKAAADPNHLTPGSVRLSSAREPWRGCRQHPDAGVREDGQCGGCWADRQDHDATCEPTVEVDPRRVERARRGAAAALAAMERKGAA